VVEPFLVGIGYIESCLLHGVTIMVNTTVVGAERGDDGSWGVRCKHVVNRDLATWRGDGRSRNGELLAGLDEDEGKDGGTTGQGGISRVLQQGNNSAEDVKVYKGKVVINAAGLFSDVIETFRQGALNLGGSGAEPCPPPPFEIKPRKGQCLVLKPTASSPDPPSHVLEQIATQFTKGVIVWTTVYGNIVIGPTADELQSRADRSTDMDTVDMLATRGADILGLTPSSGGGLQTLRDHGYQIVGTHSGIRTATEHRDYQIKAIPQDNWITVGGIRSTGLTGSPGIGEYVGELYKQVWSAPFHYSLFVYRFAFVLKRSMCMIARTFRQQLAFICFIHVLLCAFSISVLFSGGGGGGGAIFFLLPRGIAFLPMCNTDLFAPPCQCDIRSNYHPILTSHLFLHIQGGFGRAPHRCQRQWKPIPGTGGGPGERGQTQRRNCLCP
jgi:glycine/D-amino acid oxidase-like deaminating enzyme